MPNFSKTRILIFIIAVLLLANLSMLIFFIGMHDGNRKRNPDQNRGPNAINVVLEEKVGFTNSQMEKVNQLRAVHRENMHRLFEDIRQTKINFYGHINKNEVTDSALSQAATKIAEKQKAIDLEAFKNLREIRSLCTTEQIAKYDSLIPIVLERMWFPARRGNSDKRKESPN